MPRERFLVKSFGVNADAVRIAIIKFIELLENNSNGVIVVPRIEDLKHYNLADILGDDLSSQLIKKREISFTDGKKIFLCSYLTLKNYKHSNTYLALWGSKYTISAIESLSSWSAAILLTSSPQDCEQWLKEHSVSVLYDDGQG